MTAKQAEELAHWFEESSFYTVTWGENHDRPGHFVVFLTTVFEEVTLYDGVIGSQP